MKVQRNGREFTVDVTEHLDDDVADLAARGAVDAGEGGDVGLQARAEGRWRDAARQLSQPPGAAARAGGAGGDTL